MIYSEEEIKNIDELRKQLGTLPEQVPDVSPEFIKDLACDSSKWIKNEFGYLAGPIQFYEGVRGISVETIDFPKNPYRLLYEFAVATWGPEEYPTMWDTASPENRFYVVKNVLKGKALPLGNEALQFSFIIRGASRAAFDQHARMRVGAMFASQGVRDNSRLLSGFRIPNEIFRDKTKTFAVINNVLNAKALYQLLISDKENGNSFQAARCVFQMGWTHNYKHSVNFEALKGYMARRLVASEQEDTVATAILIWNEIDKRFPLLANELRPKCDKAGKCLCHQGGGDEMFGALFKGCGRFPESESNYATFNWSCSDYDLLEDQTKVYLPYPATEHWISKGKRVWKTFENLSDLDEKDRVLFEE